MRSLVLDLARLIAGAGCLLVFAAGRVESRGRLGAARRMARAGGFVAALGSALVAALSLAAGGVGGNAPFQAASALAALASGFVALLAGLAGKPRPSGAFAALLWLASLAFALALG